MLAFGARERYIVVDGVGAVLLILRRRRRVKGRMDNVIYGDQTAPRLKADQQVVHGVVGAECYLSQQGRKERFWAKLHLLLACSFLGTVRGE